MRLLSKVDGGRGHYHVHEGHGAIKEVQQQYHHQRHEQSLNFKAVYLETLSDTLGAAGVGCWGYNINY